MSKITVGILALQGDYSLHAATLALMGVSSVFVFNKEELSSVDALILPGGESTTLLKLMDEEFRYVLRDRISSGMPTFGTCAGLILLAKKVIGIQQFSFGALDISVERNAYGRQLDSFVTPSLVWTDSGKCFLKTSKTMEKSDAVSCGAGFDANGVPIVDMPLVEGVFIRAPRIRSSGQTVEVILSHGSEPVLVREGKVFGATFHPEMTPGLTLIHEMFLSTCNSN